MTAAVAAAVAAVATVGGACLATKITSVDVIRTDGTPVLRLAL